MATVSINPRYVFTRDRVPAVIIYSIATALASLIGLLAYGLFEQAGWFVRFQGQAGGAALVFDVTLFLAKLMAVAAAIYGFSVFAKRALQGSFESEVLSRRVGEKTFAAVATAAFFLGFGWRAWTEFSGVVGASFFVVLAGIAFSLLDMPFRKFSYKLIFLAVIMALFLAVMFASRSSGIAASSFAWFPPTLGLLAVVVPTSLVAWFAPYENQQSKFGSLAMILIALFVFVGGTVWTVAFSFTNIRILPFFTPFEWWDKFNGLANYTRLFNTSRWMDCPALSQIGQAGWQLKCAGSFPNVVTYAVCFIAIVMTLGFLVAVLMDQKIRAEGVFRTIYLYPFALSFIVTGHVWAWIFSPEYGLQKAVRAWGWESFSFGWIADQQMVMYAIVIAGVWQGTGFVMAIMLAGLRGIDEEIWKAARIDGIPTWRTYMQIVLPMMKPVLVTTFVFVASGAIRIYDLVIAITDGGPGVSSDVPSRYIYQHFSANLGQSLAASTIMLLSMALILVPWIRMEFGKKGQ
jgi:glucose/mannose transport system permease protein